MATDIKLDQQGGNWLVAESQIFKSTASDIMLDAPTRRRGGASPYRRALVHDFNDGLTLNYAGDYPGGVTVHGALAATGAVSAGGAVSVAGDAVVAGDLSVTGELIVGGEPLTTRYLEGQLGQAEARIASLEKTVAALLGVAGLVVIPQWPNKTEILEGDDMGMVHESAEALGLIIEYEIDQRNPNYDHEEVISITPWPGTVVPRGTTVVVRINLEG